MKILFLLAMLSIGIIGLLASSPGVYADNEPSLLFTINPFENGQRVTALTDIEVGLDGKIYTTNFVSNFITVYDSNGNFLNNIPFPGQTEGELGFPGKFAIDSNDNLYVADSPNHQVQVLDSNGNFLFKFGEHGTGDDQFERLVDIEVSNNGNILVVDSGLNANDRELKVFDSMGNFLFKHGFAIFLTTDSQDNIYILNGLIGGSIRILDSSGNFLDQFFVSLPPGEDIIVSHGISVDTNGHIFLTDSGGLENCVYEFDQFGSFISKFCEDLENQFGVYSISNPKLLEIRDSSIYVGETFNILVFSTEAVYCGKLSTEFDNVIMGTSNNDKLSGTNQNDVIIGLEGDDTINGKGGDDCLLGNNGNDVIKGGNGDDLIDAGSGDDVVKGGKGNDVIFGGNGDDVIKGEKGDDDLSGNDGDDTIRGNAGNDSISGNNGDDVIKGGKGNDVIFGGNGDDVIKGEKGDDTLFGNLGNDEIVGGKGTDTCDGGPGIDVENCELIAELSVDIVFEFSNDFEQVFPGDELETEFFTFVNRIGILDNFLITYSYGSDIQFNLERTLEENDPVNGELIFKVNDLGNDLFELTISVTNQESIHELEMVIMFDVVDVPQLNNFEILGNATTIHPNFNDPIEDNNNSIIEIVVT